MIVVILALVAAGCGHRRSHEELLAADAERAEPASRSSEVADDAGGSGGSDTDVVDDGTGTPVAADPGTGGGTTGGGTTGGQGTTGGGSGTGSGSGLGSGGGTRASCTGRESQIVIGTVGQLSGPIGSIAGLGVKAVQIWAQHVNAQGGINCHKVRYLTYDDGGDPSRHQALVQQLIERDKAIAYVHSPAILTGHSSVAYLKARGIPVIGNEGGEQWQLQHDNYFPQSATDVGLYTMNAKAYGEVGRIAGKKKLGILTCLEVQQCTKSGEVIAANAAAAGLQPVYRASGSLVQPDFTAVCQAAQSAGTEIFAVVLDTNSIRRVARSCAAVGFRPTYTSISILANEGMAEDPLLDGAIIPIPFRPYMDTSNAAVKEFVDAMAKYSNLAPTAGYEAGWVSAKIFELAAQNVSANPTSAEILEALYQIKGNDLGGLTHKLTFTRGRPAAPNYCYWLTAVKDKKFVQIGSKEPTCG